VLAFLDTEFTDLVIRPRLLSVGLVTDPAGRLGTRREFYAEVTDPDRIRATNWFGLANVLPQFGRVTDAACTYAELGSRLAAFLAELVEDLQAGECVELAHGYHLDWGLVDQALRDAVPLSWQSTRRLIRPVNVYALAGFGAGQLATEAYFKAQAGGPIARHHALCDARALRLAYEAATQPPAGPGPATMSPDPAAHRYAVA
jgi:hypothetical protein